MGAIELQHYLDQRRLRGPAPPGAHSGAAGGAPCGDLVRISLALEGGRVAAASFDGSGCAASRAAAAAAAELTEGRELTEAALLGADRVSDALGGLSAAGRHAAGLAADALHRALGAAARSGEQLLDPPESGERVLVAISGGVDSAVAALLERRRGAEVIAVTLELWSDPANDGERSCCSPEAVRSARGLAHSIGIPHLTVDLRDRFREGVVEPFLAGHAAGRTPNPCIRCNGRVRLDAMIEIAGRLGAARLATGHYARIVDDGAGPLLAAAADQAKDQGYMLAALAPSSLARLRFPLAELTKPEVRAIAREAGLAVADKRESQDLCFLAGEGKRGFLARHGGLRERPGEIVDRRGRRLGRHRGHHRFTVGQRRGIGIAAPEPLYVLATEPATNRVVVGPAPELERDRIEIRDAVLHRPGATVDAVRIRYRSKPLPCAGLVSGDAGGVAPGAHLRLVARLGSPARALAPGQTAVLLSGDRIVGHGTIC